ncbi:hypothetical protein DFH28DRAFT_925465 [Melampsora americana]|nr:hypothetical protein DFH28DRAFT_925465 [Melampsora americana]
MPSKKAIPDVFSMNLSDNRRTASLSSYRSRLPNSKFFQLFGSSSSTSRSSSSHRRSTSDTGPISFGNFKRSISPSASTFKRNVLRKTRSEGRTLKGMMPSASTWLEDFTSKIINPNSYQSKHKKDLYDLSFILKPCEEGSWTEVVKEKEINQSHHQREEEQEQEDQIKEDFSHQPNSIEFRSTSPLKNIFIERDLDPIKEVEDQRQIRTSFIDHGRSVSYDQGICLGAGIKTVGQLSVSELGVPEVSMASQPSNSYKPWQCIPHKGTPSKPYNQATGYLFTDTRPRSRSSYPSPCNSPSVSKSYLRYSYQEPKPVYHPERYSSLYDEFEEEEKTNEDQGSIRLVSIGTKELESTTLSRLPRIDPTRSLSSSYIAHRELAKENENDSIVLASNQMSSTSVQSSMINHLPIKPLYEKGNHMNENLSRTSSISTFGKTQNQITSNQNQFKSSLSFPIQKKSNENNNENLNHQFISHYHTTLKHQNQLYKSNSFDLQNRKSNSIQIKNQAKDVMSGLINLINV